MSSAPKQVFWRRWPDGLRWSLCFAVVLGMHATAAAALIGHWRAEDEPVASGPVILIDLAPAEAAPPKPQNDVAPAPEPSKPQPPPEPKLEKAEKVEQPQPEKVEKVEPPDKPAVTAALKPPPETPKPPIEKIAPAPVQVPVQPPPAETHTALKDIVMPPPRPIRRIKEERKRERLAKLTPERSTPSKHKAARATAPRAGARAHNPNAVPRWKTALVMRLQRAKRYPAEAQERGVQGVAQLAFSVDRSGRVHHPRIVRSSGSSLLDRATMQLIERAQPLPPPPPEVHGSEIAIVVPIRYNLR